MDGDDDDNDDPAEASIRFHVRSLVKNLFTQRVTKARSQGQNITNVFAGDGLELVPGARYQKRYKSLERASLMELSSILIGQMHGNQKFTEMSYLTPDPEGMTLISACLQEVRKAIAKLPAGSDAAFLQPAAEEVHGITFVCVSAA